MNRDCMGDTLLYNKEYDKGDEEGKEAEEGSHRDEQGLSHSLLYNKEYDKGDEEGKEAEEGSHRDEQGLSHTLLYTPTNLQYNKTGFIPGSDSPKKSPLVCRGIQ